jgi:hypothetical protein
LGTRKLGVAVSTKEVDQLPILLDKKGRFFGLIEKWDLNQEDDKFPDSIEETRSRN